MTRSWLGALVVTAAWASFHGSARIGAQQAAAPDGRRLAFEVASIKPNNSGDGRVMVGGSPGGRFNAVNVTPRMLLRLAYQVEDFQIDGGPKWLDSDHFDVVAKAPDGVAIGPAVPGSGPGPMQLMLQSLLADRFKLTLHRETRELPVYALVPARSDGKLGPRLTPSAVDCAATGGRRGGPPPAAPQPGARPSCGLRIGPGNFSGGGVSMAQLTQVLAQRVGRVVVDKTGLAGGYDVDLDFTPDQMPPGPPPPGVQLPRIDPNGPSIFTALQEQLGLKLESTKGPVDVLVIDHVEPPTED
jgi:uncharacterized protein (TIGR03435 family)